MDGPDIDSGETEYALATYIEVAGAKMQKDFESVHREAQGDGPSAGGDHHLAEGPEGVDKGGQSPAWPWSSARRTAPPTWPRW